MEKTDSLYVVFSRHAWIFSSESEVGALVLSIIMMAKLYIQIFHILFDLKIFMT